MAIRESPESNLYPLQIPAKLSNPFTNPRVSKIIYKINTLSRLWGNRALVGFGVAYKSLFPSDLNTIMNQ